MSDSMIKRPRKPKFALKRVVDGVEEWLCRSEITNHKDVWRKDLLRLRFYNSRADAMQSKVKCGYDKAEVVEVTPEIKLRLPKTYDPWSPSETAERTW